MEEDDDIEINENVKLYETLKRAWNDEKNAPILLKFKSTEVAAFPNVTRFPRARNRRDGKRRERIRGRERNALICDRERGVEQGEIRVEELFEDED